MTSAESLLATVPYVRAACARIAFALVAGCAQTPSADLVPAPTATLDAAEPDRIADATLNPNTTSDARADGSAAPGFDIVARYGKRWIKYVTLRKQTDLRIGYFEADLLARLSSAGPLPDGALLILELQGLNAPTAGFVAFRRKQDSGWAGLTHTVRDPAVPLDFSGGIGTACNAACHGAAKEDLTYTLPSLRRFLSTRMPETMSCPGSAGQAPCPPATYETGR